MQYYFYMLVMYFYSWFRMSFIYSFLYTPTPTPIVQVYVCDNQTQTMRPWQEQEEPEEQEQEQEQKEQLTYYILCDGSILVFKDAQIMHYYYHILSTTPGGSLHRRPFRYFMEAECSDGVDVLPLLTRYDNGHGTFFQDLTHYALTPMDLYDFDNQRFVFINNNILLHITPLNTLEPRTIALEQQISDLLKKDN